MRTDPTAQPRGRRFAISTAALTCALLAGGVLDASAQDDADRNPVLSGAGHRVVSGVYPGLVTVVTRHGPAGTVLKFAAKQLPRNSDVQIMIGALRDGEQVIQVERTDDDGRIRGQDTVQVIVPDWVKTDRPYLVMVTDLQYNWLAAADMFHPTTAEGDLVRRGTINRDQPACPTLTSEGGELYVLAGDTSPLVAGQEMLVKGRVVEPGACGNITTIDVRKSAFPPKG